MSVSIRVEKKVEGWIEKLTKIKEEVTTEKDELQEKWDSHSESWQEGDNGAEMQDVIDKLDELESSIESAIEELQGIG